MQKQVSSSHPNIAKACNNIAKNVNEKTKIQGRKHLSFFRDFFANSCPPASNFNFFLSLEQFCLTVGQNKIPPLKS